MANESNMFDLHTDRDESRDEEDNTKFVSMAPVRIRGLFSVFDSVREHVSKDRARYKLDGFNLDMRYIAPSIVCMATPADRGTFSLVARNHVEEVQRFIRQKHNGKAMVFNLVGEANGFVFDGTKLGGVNHDFAFLDHQVPSLSSIQEFCKAMKRWLDAESGNIAIVMCRSGRNRSAVMVCSFLMYCWPEEFRSASDAMEYFSWRRMRNGEAVVIPSQKRYISYFSQRFAAEPQEVRISRVVIPVGPLAMDKLRLEFVYLMTGNKKEGNSHEFVEAWSSKGKQMGKVEEGESFVLFDFSDPLVLTGDVKLRVSGRKFATGGFTPIFSFWFNTGFIDHTPMVWDKACFDDLSGAWRKALPDDFHIQTLFLDKPRVSCSVEPNRAARIYCWDCENPFLSAEASVSIHKPRTVVAPDGTEEDLVTGPQHRYHPLVEEDCAICRHRQRHPVRQPGDDLKLPMTSDENQLAASTNTMDYSKLQQKMALKKQDIAGSKDGTVYSVEEGLKMLSGEKQKKEAERRREMMYYAQVKVDPRTEAPLFGLPTVYCTDTKSFICSWCNKYGLSEKQKKAYTRFALPLVASSKLRYSGCARQVC